MNKTNIEWTTFSANPIKFRTPDGQTVWGCVRVSPGCQHCYAEATGLRYNRGGPFTQPVMNTLTPYLCEKEMQKMLTAKMVDGIEVAGSKVFIGDMTDIFGDWVPDEMLDKLFAVFALRKDVTWQVLTKRPERMEAYVNGEFRANKVFAAMHALTPKAGVWSWPTWEEAMQKVWLGTSVENQEYAIKRIPHLLRTQATVRFISYEPGLGPVNLAHLDTAPELHLNALTGLEIMSEVPANGPKLSWVIVGGESGDGARPFEIEWARRVVRQCKAANVAVFVKQLGKYPLQPEVEFGLQGPAVVRRSRELDAEWPKGTHFGNRTGNPTWNGRQPLLKSKKGGDWNEWPTDLRVRQFPNSPGMPPLPAR